MKRASKFTMSSNWQVMLLDMGISPERVLKQAGLPGDLFIRSQSVSPQEFFSLWHAVEQVAGDKEVPLLFANSFSAEAFDAPIFASLCSPNLNTALQRLQHYKPLIGPMILELDINKRSTRLTVSCYGYQDELPRTYNLCELVFFTQLVRLATREHIQPLKAVLPTLPIQLDTYNSYFGCQLAQGNEISLEFSAEDANRPFLTANETMWTFFEDKLNRKLSDLSASASIIERVRAILLESLPSGESSIESTAAKLAISKRTLQRKLTSEGESYQAVLNNVRIELADHYLKKSTLSLGEISFLLGFQEANSFIRAYSHWRGVSPGQYREQYH